MKTISQLVAVGGELPLYTLQDPDHRRYRRNPRHWLKGFNLAGVSPWNSLDGPRLHVNRPTRAAILASHCDEAWATVSSMWVPNPRRFAAAWRLAAQSWLHGQGLISVSPQPPNPHHKQTAVTPFPPMVSLTQNRNTPGGVSSGAVLAPVQLPP